MDRCPKCGYSNEREPTIEMLRRWCRDNSHHIFSPDDSVAPETAAKLVRRSERTLGNWRGAADHFGLPFYRPGKRGPLRYRLEDIATWIDEARKDSDTGSRE